MPTFEQIQNEITSMLSVPDDELTAEQLHNMDAYLDELAGLESGKIDGFAQFCRIQGAWADACAAEAKRLKQKAKTATERISYLKQRYIDTMRCANLKKVQGSAYTISVRESEAVAVTAMLDTLPELYLRSKTTVEPDKLAIKEALKGGLEIPGCELAKAYSLQIR